MKLAIAFVLVAGARRRAPRAKACRRSRSRTSRSRWRRPSAPGSSRRRPDARQAAARNPFANAAGVLPRRRDADAVERLGHQDRSLAARRRLERQAAGGRQRRVGGQHLSIRRWRRRSRPATRPSSTDTGHAGGNANFMVGHPEKLMDFEERAVHEMTVTAKAVAAAFYGSAPHAGVLQRLLDRRASGADRSAAIPARFRRDRRRRAGQLREAADVRPDLAVAGHAQGRRRAC